MPPTYRLFLILAAILPLASIHDAQGVDVDRATELTRRARELVVRGEAFQAIALLQSELHPANDPQAQAYLLFTRGWLEQKVAEDATADRATHLAEAARLYGEGLELMPGFPAARAGLALVQGDLALESGERSEALASWRRALNENPADNSAGLRLLDLLSGDVKRLSEEARFLERNGYLDLSRQAWERVIAHTPAEAAGDPLLRWLLIEAETLSFDETSLQRLAAGGSALAELRRFAARPLDTPPPSWTGSLLGHQASAASLRCLGRLSAEQGDVEDALARYERAIELAPDPPLIGRVPIGLLASLDAAELLQQHQALDPGGARMDASIEHLLASLDAAQSSGSVSRQRYHDVLGNLLAGRLRWSADTPAGGEFHLRRVIAIEREQSNLLHPLPRYSLLIAEGCIHRSAALDAIGHYLDAAHGFLDLRAYPQADAALRAAAALAPTSARSLQRLGELQARLFSESALALPLGLSIGPIEEDPHCPPTFQFDGLLMRIFDPEGRGGLFSPSPLTSWGGSAAYGGYSVGGSGTDQTARDVENTLSGLDWDITATLDGSTDGTRLYLGYRLAGPFALEIGYTDLGTIESVIGPDPTDPVELAQFLSDISRTHPAKGSGLTVAGRALILGTDELNLSAKCGLWMWSADVDVLTSTSSVKIDRDGTDLFYGFDLAWYPVEWGSIRLDYERYTCDDTDADLFSVGLEFALDRLLDKVH